MPPVPTQEDSEPDTSDPENEDVNAKPTKDDRNKDNFGGKGYDNDDDGDEDNNDDDDDDGDESDGAGDTVPVSKQIRLADHRGTVSALSIDPAGSRIVTGGRDYSIRLWDFHGMDTNFRPFRTLSEPCGGYPIRDAKFSITGDRFLVAPGSEQIKLFDREGGKVAEYAKGDPYLRDQSKTKGHVAALTSGRWHPNDKNTFLTASLDSTIRIWDVEKFRENAKVITVKSKDRGGKTPVTSATYSLDGRVIACAGLDGCLRLWNANGPFISPTQVLEKAHIPQSTTSSIVFSPISSYTLLSRSFDDTLKLWDLRAFKAPVATVSGLSLMHEEADAIFSPDGRLAITGTSADRGDPERKGRVCFFDVANGLQKAREDLRVVGAAVRLLWHGRINQIAVGTSEGAVNVFYDEKVSAAGAKLCADKRSRARRLDELPMADESARVIHTPHALPLFREEMPRKGKRKLAKLRSDPVATKMPERPLSGPGRGGKIGASTVQQHVLKGLIKDETRTEDPREAILKHAEAAAAKPFWVDPAYKKSQPKPIMAAAVFEDEEEELDASKRKRPK
ncbi:transcription factor [Zopfochytrium polystomum]|nr:transcription factor [Zopfochytrium polystomum]